MYLIAYVFLGVLFKGLVGAEVLNYMKMQFGLDLLVGAEYGSRMVMIQGGVQMFAVPL
jgi:ACR3 family arsenite transporter|tara:strand:+ start:44 stop:217 length:174 start_codon:yes stop_codon:yes gene_type:complete